MSLERAILALIVASTIISMAVAIPGQATFYTTYVSSSCYGFTTQGTMIAAANSRLFNNGAACGRTCRVRCTGGTNNSVPQPCLNDEITVKIVDFCIGCNANQLDLFEQAFEMIADPNAGRIQIEYNCS